MRRVLVTFFLLECVLLLAGAVTLGLFGDRFRREAPVSPSFVPPIYSAVIGDSVRYRRVDAQDENRDLGYVDYVIKDARIIRHSGLGAEFNVLMTERGFDGRQRSRTVRVQPRLIDHGFLPLAFDEIESLDVPGGRPVILSIRTSEVDGGQGFIIETVRPRHGLDTVSGRLFMRPDVPVFGVVRWERGDEVWILHRSNREKRRRIEEGE